MVSTPKWRQEARRKGDTSSGHKKKLKGVLMEKQVVPDLSETNSAYLQLKRAMIQGL